jgi:hypothetical protein
MSVIRMKWKYWLPTGVLVLAMGLGLTAGAQETAPRQGIWVEFLFGTGVDLETRSVIDQGTVFTADGEKVYCMTRVHGMSPPTSVTHAWYYEGKTMARVDLTVGSENWRTWSSKSYLPSWTGSWEVKVLDPDGMVLGSAGFEVK